MSKAILHLLVVVVCLSSCEAKLGVKLLRKPSSVTSIGIAALGNSVHSIRRGETMNLEANATLPDGSVQNITEYVNWDLQQDRCQGVSLTSDGKLTVSDDAEGQVIVKASYKGTKSSIEFGLYPSLKMSYSNSSYIESSTLNDGSFAGAITVSIVGDEFSSSLSSENLAVYGTIPSGLTLKIVRTSSTTASLTLAGNAKVHSGDASTSIGLVFLREAFASGVGAVQSPKPIDIFFGDDLNGPALAFAKPLDPIVRAGETMPVYYSASDPSGYKLTYALSSDGIVYGSETDVDTSSSRFDVTWPTGWTGKITEARLRLKAIDKLGHQSQLTSGPIMVLRKSVKFAGGKELAHGAVNGSATDTRYHGPQQVASDGTYLYIGQYQNIERVRISDGVSENLVGVYGTASTAEGVGRAARLETISGLEVLGDYLYVSVWESHVLVKVNINSGSPDYKTATIAVGSVGVSGSTDDASNGLNARLKNPTGIATDGTYLYIGDSSNSTLRRYDPSTTGVTTLAGTAGSAGSTNATGTAARLNGPYGVCYGAGASSGASGSIYMAELSGWRIRRYDIATAAVTTLSGRAHQGLNDGAASVATFHNLRGCAVDSGFLYVADSVGHVIRKVSLTDGSTTTVAGGKGQTGYVNHTTGTSARLSRPMGVEVVGSYLYIAEESNNTIRRMNLSTTAVESFSGPALDTSSDFDPDLSNTVGTGALFSVGPYALVADIDSGTPSNSALYVMDSRSSVIRSMNLSTSVVSTLAGTAFETGTSNGVGSAARMSQPRGAVKARGVIYFSDHLNHTIRTVNPADGTVATVAGLAGTSGSTNGNGTSARFRNPWGLAADANYLYIADSGNHMIRRMTLDAPYTVVTIAGSTTSGISDHATGTSAKFNGPKGLAVLNSVLYVADTDNHAIRSVAISSSPYAVTTVAGSPSAVAGYVNDVGTASRFSSPYSVIAENSKLYIADYANGAIRTFDPADQSTATVAGGTSTTPFLQDGYGVAARTPTPIALASGGGYLYFTSASYPLIFRMDLNTSHIKAITGGVSVTTRYNQSPVAGYRDGAATVATPHLSASCAAQYGTYVYVIDWVGTIRRVNASDFSGALIVAGAIDDIGVVNGNGTSARLGLARGCAVVGQYLYFTQSYHHVIRRLNLMNYDVETVAGSHLQHGGTDGSGTAATFNQPSGLVATASALYVTDGIGTTIRVVSLEAATFGRVTTLAGQYGVSSYTDGEGGKFALISDIALLDQELYVTEVLGVLRKISITGGAISTVAGSYNQIGYQDGPAATARFNKLHSVFSDGVNIWLGDRGNYILRKYRPATDEVTSVIGVPYVRQLGVYGDLPGAPASSFDKVMLLPGLGIFSPMPHASTIYQ